MDSWKKLQELNVGSGRVQVAQTTVPGFTYTPSNAKMNDPFEAYDEGKNQGKAWREKRNKKQTTAGDSSTKEDLTTVGKPGGVGGPTQNQEVDFQEKMRQIAEAVLSRTFI